MVFLCSLFCFCLPPPSPPLPTTLHTLPSTIVCLTCCLCPSSVRPSVRLSVCWSRKATMRRVSGRRGTSASGPRSTTALPHKLWTETTITTVSTPICSLEPRVRCVTSNSLLSQGPSPNFYRPQTKFAKVMFLHVSVILSTGGGACSRGVCLVETPPDCYCCGPYASYWNAFLSIISLEGYKQPQLKKRMHSSRMLQWPCPGGGVSAWGCVPRGVSKHYLAATTLRTVNIQWRIYKGPNCDLVRNRVEIRNPTIGRHW